MKQFRKRLVKSAIAVTLAFTTAVSSAAMSSPIVAQAVTEHYEYNDAKKLLNYVNEMRRSTKYSWYRNKSNKKVRIKNLKELYWSSELAGYAERRASAWGRGSEGSSRDPDDYLPRRWHYERELACWSANSSSTPGNVFDVWCHESDGHEDQKNRRKLLSHDATYMGAACWVKSNGQKYWIVILANPSKKERQGVRKGKTNPKHWRGAGTNINASTYSSTPSTSSSSSSRSSSSSSSSSNAAAAMGALAGSFLGALGGGFGGLFKQDVKVDLDNGAPGGIQVMEMSPQ